MPARADEELMRAPFLGRDRGPAGRRRTGLRRRAARRRRIPPDGLQYLFVVTYGRSGSTLLQGILNSLPGVLVRGENRQLLRHLWRFDVDGHEERRLLRRIQVKSGRLPTTGDPTRPYFGMEGFPTRRTRDAIRHLALETLLRPDPDTRVVGFKEIRWEEEDVGEYVAWLREVFPGARFVVNTRDLDETARSKWWADRPDAREHLAQVERRILDVTETLGAAAYRVHYDEYVAHPDRLQGLAEWLGVPWDLDAVLRTMGRPHSY